MRLAGLMPERPAPGNCLWQVPAEEVEQEIQDIEHSIRVLTLIRDHVLPHATYLLGRVADVDPEEEIRWVTRAAD
jgi:hypothetical protein